MSSKQIRTRIAPSPTGLFNMATARTGLFNYLFAKKHGGAFILRIEDTDRERSTRESEKDILEGFKWLGINPDEGPDIGGEYAPYRQSERAENHAKYLKKLWEDGKIYFCFHTTSELDQEAAKAAEEKKPLVHVCSFREYSLEDQKKLLTDATSHTEHVIRFKTPLGKIIEFDDLIRGKVSFHSDALGDFSIAKDLELPLYNFAVVIDDHEMGITHVIRGEDHISNTPKQLLLLDALEWDKPIYAHSPLILGADRSKMSKRHGATGMLEYKEAGYLPEALINFMVFLGWNPGTNQEIFSLAELEKEFSLEKVQKSGAVFNQEKLDWFNGHYIRQKSSRDLAHLCKAYFPELKLEEYPMFEKIVELEKPRLKKLSELSEKAKFFFILPEYEASLLMWKENSKEETKKALDNAKNILGNLKPEEIQKAHLEKIFFEEASKNFKDKGSLLWPLRAALSGQKASPGPFEIMEILGREESLRRIETALQKVV